MVGVYCGIFKFFICLDFFLKNMLEEKRFIALRCKKVGPEVVNAELVWQLHDD